MNFQFMSKIALPLSGPNICKILKCYINRGGVIWNLLVPKYHKCDYLFFKTNKK